MKTNKMKNDSLMNPLLFSVGIHLALLSFLLPNYAQKQTAPQKQGAKKSSKSIPVTIIPKAPPGGASGPGNKASANTKKGCPKWYGGVGISLTWDTQAALHKITDVGVGYPGEAAGILVGDYLLNGEDIRGEPGTSVEVQVYRPSKEKVYKFNVVRDKICIKED